MSRTHRCMISIMREQQAIDVHQGEINRRF
jgi:hypothetical protein